MGKEYYIMKMELNNMKEILKMVDLKEREFIMMKMEIKNMKDFKNGIWDGKE